MTWQIRHVEFDAVDGLIEWTHLIDRKNQLHMMMGDDCGIGMGADTFEACPIMVTFSKAHGVSIERVDGAKLTEHHPRIIWNILRSVGASHHDCNSVSRTLRALYLAHAGLVETIFCEKCGGTLATDDEEGCTAVSCLVRPSPDE